MGRRLNVSTPTVINTELVPLDESFYIDVDGQLEQWYYDNTEQYAPNRKVTPLLLVPVISAFDKDTNTSYDPTFNTTQWFESAYREDYSVRHDFGVSAYAQAEAGREYPSDISSWRIFPEISFEAKPYLWHRITKTIGGSTTVTYELVQVKDTPVYVVDRALSYFPDEPEERDVVVVTDEHVDYYVYENGVWGDYYLNNGQAIDVTDLKEIWVLVDDNIYGKWYKIPYSSQNGGYVETEITNQVESGSADYVIQGNNLLVKKNVSYSHAVSIRCVAKYIDPRDSGVTYAVEDSVNLTTNRTADVVFPEVDIISPSGRAYNPLVDDTNSQYDFKGVTTNNPVQPLNTDVRRYPVDVDGTEEILNSGEAVAPIMDIRYGENPTMEDQEFMYRQTADGELVGESIDKAYIERIKGNSGVVEGVLLSVKMNAIQTKGANNSWTKTQNLPITTLTGKLNGAGNSVTIFQDGMKKCGEVYDSEQEKYIPICDEIFVEGGVVKAIKRVGSRAYESGDESDTNVITDGSTTTFYALTTPQTYVLDPITDFVWYGIKDGQEVLADTLPWYVSGQGTDNLVVDAMYGENINVVLRCKMMDGETLSPSKAYATLSWRTPDIETFVQSDNGGAVRSDTEDMTFDTIVNVNGDVLSDALKQKHLAFNWKIRKNNTSTEIDKGWGQRITIDASDLRNVKGSGSTLASTIVGNEVYLKGAYEEVTDNGEVITDGGEVVYDRPVD